MDANAVLMNALGHWLKALWPLLLIVPALAAFRRFVPTIKGWLGEQAVRRRLDRDLSAGQLHTPSCCSKPAGKAIPARTACTSGPPIWCGRSVPGRPAC